MSNYSGNDVKLQIGLETEYGTAVTPTLALEVTNFNINVEPSIIESNALVGAAMSHTISPGMKRVSGSFTIEVNPDNIGLLLSLMCGSEAAAAQVDETSAYEHIFTPITGGTSLSSFTIICDKKTDVFTYSGCKINSINFEVAPDGYLLATIEIVGQQELLTGSLAALDYSSLKPFKFTGLAVKFGTAGTEAGTTISDCKTFSPNYTNNLEGDRYRADGNDYTAEIDYQKREMTASIECDYTEATNVYRESNFKVGTGISVKGLFTHESEIETDYPYLLEMDILYGYITSAPVDVPGPERLSISFDVKATNGTNGNIAFTLRDASSEKYIS